MTSPRTDRRLATHPRIGGGPARLQRRKVRVHDAVCDFEARRNRRGPASTIYCQRVTERRDSELSVRVFLPLGTWEKQLTSFDAPSPCPLPKWGENPRTVDFPTSLTATCLRTLSCNPQSSRSLSDQPERPAFGPLGLSSEFHVRRTKDGPLKHCRGGELCRFVNSQFPAWHAACMVGTHQTRL